MNIPNKFIIILPNLSSYQVTSDHYAKILQNTEELTLSLKFYYVNGDNYLTLTSGKWVSGRDSFATSEDEINASTENDWSKNNATSGKDILKIYKSFLEWLKVQYSYEDLTENDS